MPDGIIHYPRYRFPSAIIGHAVWLYCRFTLSFHDVEDLLAQRGIIVSYETVRHWCQTFGLAYARRLRRGRGRMGDHFQCGRGTQEIERILVSEPPDPAGFMHQRRSSSSRRGKNPERSDRGAVGGRGRHLIERKWWVLIYEQQQVGLHPQQPAQHTDAERQQRRRVRARE